MYNQQLNNQRTNKLMPTFPRGWLCRELRVPAFVENGLPQWMEDHFMKTRPLTQEIRWIIRSKDGTERCRGHSEAGHKCLNQVGLGRRGVNNQEDNAGFCYVCRPETDEFIRSTTDSSIRTGLRQLKQATNYWRDTPHAEHFRMKEERYRNYLVEHRRRVQETKEKEQRIIAEKQAAITLFTMKILDSANSLGIDPIKVLIDKGMKDTAIRYFHDSYVLWVKKQDNYTEEICSICIEPCTDNEKYNECGHLFHKACIEKWNMKKGCPNCRATC